MKLTMHVTERRPLVDLISEFAGEDAVYMRAPTYAYQIGEYTVTRDGNLLAPDDLDADALHELYEVLSGGGYQPKEAEPVPPVQDEAEAGDGQEADETVLASADTENAEIDGAGTDAGDAAEIKALPIRRVDKSSSGDETVAQPEVTDETQTEETPGTPALPADTVARLNSLRNSMIRMINRSFDEILRANSTSLPHTAPAPANAEPAPAMAPGGTATITLNNDFSMLRGTKPVLVRYGDEVVYAASWKRVVAAVLDICNRQEEYHNALLEARNDAAGRGRRVIADSPQGMLSPLRVDEGLYVETNFSTEALLKLLRDRILGRIGFDTGSFTFEYHHPY